MGQPFGVVSHPRMDLYIYNIYIYIYIYTHTYIGIYIYIPIYYSNIRDSVFSLVTGDMAIY